MPVEKYTATDIIRRFRRSHHYWQTGAIMAHELECLLKPDILTIEKKNLRVREYEIKVSYSDLKRELDVIDTICQTDNWVDIHSLMQRRAATNEGKQIITSNKQLKHARNLGKIEGGYRPNLFYFIMPKEIFERANSEGRFKGLPYGVFDAQHFFCLRKPQVLHTDKVITEEMLWRICATKDNLIDRIEELEQELLELMTIRERNERRASNR